MTPDQEVITNLDQITDLPLNSDKAASLTVETVEQSAQRNGLFVPLVVDGQDTLLAQDEPANGDAANTLDPPEVVSLSATLPHSAYLPLVTQ